MSWDRTWKCRNKKLTLHEFNTAVQAVVTEYQGVTGRVEKESDDCWTCYFTVPKEDGDVNTYEVSLYNIGKMGLYSVSRWMHRTIVYQKSRSTGKRSLNRVGCRTGGFISIVIELCWTCV